MEYLISTHAELATLPKDKLLERCLQLQTALDKSHKPIPGQPKYLQTPDGFMMWQEREITLSKESGTIAAIPGSVGNIISALGWDLINETLRVSIYNDTKIERIIDNGIFKGIRVRGAAVGSIGGVPNVTTLALEFNFYEMFLRELVGISKFKKTCARMGIKEQKPTGNNPWVFYQIEGEAGIWVDPSHEEIIKKIQTLQQRRQWPDRLAFAFLRRNLIRKFAGGISQKCKNFTRKLTVKGWYYPISKDRMERIALAALDGKQADGEIEYKSGGIETVENPEDAETVETELVDESTGEVVESAGTAEPNQMTDVSTGSVTEKTPEEKAELEKAKYSFGIMTKNSKLKLKEKFPNRVSTYGLEDLKKINKLISELVDKQAAQI